MQRMIAILLGSGWALVLLVSGLWFWRRGGAIVYWIDPAKPQMMVVASHCAGVAIIAAGEAILVWLVIGNIWRRDRLTSAFGLLAATVFLFGTGLAALLGSLAR